MTEINKNIISNSDHKIKINTLNHHSRTSLGLNINTRKDAYGNVISKKLKRHRISFADQVENSREFVEIKAVKSFRNEYKIKNEEEGRCFIF